jgi:methionine-rich copper-binding protein CopC
MKPSTTSRTLSITGSEAATITTRIALLSILLSLSLAQIVFAHASYVRSQPGEGAIVATAPEQVEIWFSQELFRRQGENWIRVLGPDGAAVHSGEAQIDDDDRTHMWVDLQEGLAAGEYRVNWRNLSAEDGDNDEGTFTFTVDPRAEVTSTPMQAVTATPPPTAEPQVTSATSPTLAVQTPDAESGRSGCFLGMFPLVGLVALMGMAAVKRKQ